MPEQSFDQDRKIYEKFQNEPKDGETWFLISTKWMKKWLGYFQDSEDEPPGPIDNSSILEGDLKTLKQQLIEGPDYYLLPQSAWDELVEKYTIVEGQLQIARKVITVGMYSKQTSIEIYPPKFTFKLHGTNESCKLVFSRVAPMETVHNGLKELFEIKPGEKTRLYMENSVDEIKLELTLEDNGIGPNQVVVLEKQNEDGKWPRGSPSPPSYSQAMQSSSSSQMSKSTSANSSTSYNSYSTRSYDGSSYGRQAKPGLCGLSNLGNTCFMNSAIQCLSNVPALTMYFQELKYKDEINKTNPIGMKGKLAEAYAELVHDMWSGANSSVAPRDFKYNVARFEPRFSGYQQHDSQELMAFLIDGLHEDLNRITQKPYVELKSSNGRPDHVVADEAWTNHLKRNDSIIVDMFHGLFKSTLICPDCGKDSITFDPYGFLSLPLPRSTDISVIVNFVPKNSEKPITRYNLSLPKDGSHGDITKKLASMMGINARNLVVTDVYNHRFYKVFKGSERLSSYSDRDDLFVFELGTDEGKDVEYAKVYMRRSSYGSMSSMSLFGHPFLIPVESGVTTYRKLYNSVLSALKRYIKPDYLDQVKMLSEKTQQQETEQLDHDEKQDTMETSEHEESESKTTEDETKWFKIILIDSYGSSSRKELPDTNKPLKFSADTYFSAEWDSDVCEKYGVEDWSDTVVQHESMTKKNRQEIN